MNNNIINHDAMDIVFIEQLIIMAKIGVHDWEKQQLQKLIFDLQLGWNNFLAASTDNVSNCLSYSDVSRSICSLVDGKQFSLVERVAEEVAKQLIRQFCLSWVKIKVSKPGAVINAANVGVIIERKN